MIIHNYYKRQEKLLVYEPKTAKLVHEIQSHNNNINWYYFDKDEKSIIICDSRGHIMRCPINPTFKELIEKGRSYLKNKNR